MRARRRRRRHAGASPTARVDERLQRGSVTSPSTRAATRPSRSSTSVRGIAVGGRVSRNASSAAPPSSHDVGIGDAEGGDVRARGLRALVAGVDADEAHAARRPIVLVQPLQPRRLGPARRAPRGPHVDHDDVPARSRQVERLPPSGCVPVNSRAAPCAVGRRVTQVTVAGHVLWIGDAPPLASPCCSRSAAARPAARPPASGQLRRRPARRAACVMPRAPACRGRAAGRGPARCRRPRRSSSPS